MFPLLTSNWQLCYMMMRTLKISQYHQKEPRVNVFFQVFFFHLPLVVLPPFPKVSVHLLVTIISSWFRNTHTQGSFMKLKLAQMVFFFCSSD